MFGATDYGSVQATTRGFDPKPICSVGVRLAQQQVFSLTLFEYT
jgi:hypothetical protein